MTKQDAAIARIMKLNRDMTRDEEFEAILREELTAAFKRGRDKARKDKSR